MLRRLIIRAEGRKRSFRSSMSLVEIMRALFDKILNYDVSNPNWEKEIVVLARDTGV